MKNVWHIIGRGTFWVTWPGLWLMLRWSYRTRLLLVCGTEFLAVRSWLNAGDWGLPGGGRHRHESAVDGVIREVHEETGISLTQSQLTHAFDGLHKDKGLRFQYAAFTARLDHKPAVKPQAREIADISWQRLDKPAVPLNQDTTAILNWWRANH